MQRDMSRISRDKLKFLLDFTLKTVWKHKLQCCQLALYTPQVSSNDTFFTTIHFNSKF